MADLLRAQNLPADHSPPARSLWIGQGGSWPAEIVPPMDMAAVRTSGLRSFDFWYGRNRRPNFTA